LSDFEKERTQYKTELQQDLHTACGSRRQLLVKSGKIL